MTIASGKKTKTKQNKNYKDSAPTFTKVQLAYSIIKYWLQYSEKWNVGKKKDMRLSFWLTLQHLTIWICAEERHKSEDKLVNDHLLLVGFFNSSPSLTEGWSIPLGWCSGGVGVPVGLAVAQLHESGLLLGWLMDRPKLSRAGTKQTLYQN